MNTNENSSHSFTEGSDMFPSEDSGTLKFSKPTPNFPKGGEEIKDGEFVSSVKEETKHTPGPWTIRNPRGRGHDVTTFLYIDADTQNLSVAKILQAENSRSEEEAEANARLIASAPDLLIERDYWLEQAKQSNKENQELKARVKDFEFAASVNHDAYNKQKALNAELLEAIEASKPIVIESVEKWSNGEDCYTSALNIIGSAINKAKS